MLVIDSRLHCAEVNQTRPHAACCMQGCTMQLPTNAQGRLGRMICQSARFVCHSDCLCPHPGRCGFGCLKSLASHVVIYNPNLRHKVSTIDTAEGFLDIGQVIRYKQGKAPEGTPMCTSDAHYFPYEKLSDAWCVACVVRASIATRLPQAAIGLLLEVTFCFNGSTLGNIIPACYMRLG